MASPSTLNRFQYAYSRRQHELPPEDRPAFREMDSARTQRLYLLNDFLLDWFVRNRRQPPSHVIVDLDGTDDPVHGRQALSGYHGYYRQHQYFPLLALEGNCGFPLAVWLRPGQAGGNWGVVETYRYQDRDQPQRQSTAFRGDQSAWPSARNLSGLAEGGECPRVGPALR